MGERAVIVTQGWEGRMEHECTVIGETPKKYRVKLENETKLPSGVWMKGSVVLVPKGSVIFEGGSGNGK